TVLTARPGRVVPPCWRGGALSVAAATPAGPTPPPPAPKSTRDHAARATARQARKATAKELLPPGSAASRPNAVAARCRTSSALPGLLLGGFSLPRPRGQPLRKGAPNLGGGRTSPAPLIAEPDAGGFANSARYGNPCCRIECARRHTADRRNEL